MMAHLSSPVLLRSSPSLCRTEYCNSVIRIGPAGIVNKYIGDTEKDLHRLLDVAEEPDVILLFHEAKALFDKCGEVKDSHEGMVR
jgi:SpoVK/Ycf46/Vps4 family AAA+-type ATPase